MGESVQQPGVNGQAVVHTVAEPPPQVASDAREASSKAFIGKLVKARKDLAFYPKGNPAVRKAIQACEEAQSETIANHGALDLVISKDQFYADGRPLFRSESPERKFAAELFVLGLRRIGFTGEAGVTEFEEFMDLLREAQDDPALFASALSGSSEQRMKGIHLDRISDLEIVHDSSLVEEMDRMFERVTEHDESEQESATVADDLCVLILPGRLQPGQLSKLLEKPARLEEAFGRLARPRQGTAEGAVAAEVGARVLQGIAAAIGDVPLNEQRQLYRKAAELLFDVADPLRMQVVFDKILPRVTGSSPEGALIRSLSDDEIVQLLTTRVPMHEGALRAVALSFRNLELSLPRRESVLEALREKTTVSGGQSEAYTRLFDALSSAAELTNGTAAFISALEEAINAPAAPMKCLELTRDESLQIQRAAECTGVSRETENIPAMLDLLHLERDTQRYLNILETLEAARKEALREGRLALAIRVAQGYSAGRQPQERPPEQRETCEKLLEEAVGQDTITYLADMALHNERNSSEYELILEYLQTVPEHAQRELLHRLAEEKSRHLRLAIRGLLIALGSADITSLSSRVLDERWFVARNTVSILGEIGGEGVVETLSKALEHEEPRVRREALNALGKIGGEGAARSLATAVDDGDNDVALCAARWLTMIGGIAPLDGLIRIVESGRFRQIDLEIVLSAVQAIARRDSPEAIDFLRRTARIRIASLFGSGRQIATCAARALREKDV
jgi:hypothetical protein